MRYGVVSPSGLRPEAQRQSRQSPMAVPERPKFIGFLYIHNNRIYETSCNHTLLLIAIVH